MLLVINFTLLYRTMIMQSPYKVVDNVFIATATFFSQVTCPKIFYGALNIQPLKFYIINLQLNSLIQNRDVGTAQLYSQYEFFLWIHTRKKALEPSTLIETACWPQLAMDIGRDVNGT